MDAIPKATARRLAKLDERQARTQRHIIRSYFAHLCRHFTPRQIKALAS